MFSQSNLRALLSTEKMAGFLRKEFASLIRLQIYDIAIAVFEYFANFFQIFFFEGAGAQSFSVISHLSFSISGGLSTPLNNIYIYILFNEL